MFFDKKAKKVEKLLVEDFDQIDEILSKLQIMMKDYINRDKHFKDESFHVHEMETKADKIRRKICQEVYEGAFLPVYRESYLRFIEMVDKIANQAEAIGDFVTLTRPDIPEFLNESIFSILEKTSACFQPLKEMLISFLNGKGDLPVNAKTLRQVEQEIDTIQFHCTREVFKTDLEKIEKFHLKNLIDGISKISNHIEDASDYLMIVASKLKF
jgi:predicted phosphate transport protein (TIGR00153 family)